MLRSAVDLVACFMQTYIGSNIICILFPIKENRSRSFSAVFIMQLMSYFLVNYIFSATPMERICCGTVIFIVGAMAAFEGGWVKKVGLGILMYGFFLLIDLSLQFLIFPSYTETIMSLPPLDQKMLGRNLGAAALFFVYLICAMFFEKREVKQPKSVFCLALGFIVTQVGILNILALSNPKELIENGITITAVGSLLLIGGFLVVNELFQQMLVQQKKQAELEQMTLEQEYQYDYYKKAHEQSEYMRDMRHDMRNQLQTVSALFQLDTPKDRERAREMIQQLGEKLGTKDRIEFHEEMFISN